jgi:hypothetical protein
LTRLNNASLALLHETFTLCGGEWEDEPDEKINIIKFKAEFKRLVDAKDLDAADVVARMQDATMHLMQEQQARDKAKEKAEARATSKANKDRAARRKHLRKEMRKTRDEGRPKHARRRRGRAPRYHDEDFSSTSDSEPEAKHKKKKKKETRIDDSDDFSTSTSSDLDSKLSGKHRKNLRDHLKHRDYGLTKKNVRKLRKALKEVTDSSDDSNSFSSDSDKSLIRALKKKTKRGVGSRGDILKFFTKAVDDKTKKFETPAELWRLFKKRLRKANTDPKRERAMAYFRVLWQLVANMGIGAAREHNTRFMEAVKDKDASTRKPKDPIIMAEIIDIYEARGYASKRKTRGSTGGGGGRGGGPAGDRDRLPQCKTCGRRHRGKCLEKMTPAERKSFDESSRGRRYSQDKAGT